MKNNIENLFNNLPNMVSLLTLISGLTSIRFAFLQEWKLSLSLIIVATVFDFLDGWLARRYNKTSKFGAELDSLSDFISFGVAPAIIIFLWSLQYVGLIGWVPVLIFSICSALRLARFTADLNILDVRIKVQEHFIGVPSPAAAALVLLPILISFETNTQLNQYPFLIIIYMVFIGYLMISKIPTISFKKFTINKKFQHWIFLLLLVLFVFLVTKFWTILIIFTIIYFLSIIITVYKNKIPS